jgi:hypothetical protein
MDTLTKVGHWSFVVGIILAILTGFSTAAWIPTVLGILGLIVGFLNVKEQESTPFLVAVIALLLIGTAVNLRVAETSVVSSILANFVAFVAAAGLVVAIKQVLSFGRQGE